MHMIVMILRCHILWCQKTHTHVHTAGQTRKTWQQFRGVTWCHTTVAKVSAWNSAIYICRSSLSVDSPNSISFPDHLKQRLAQYRSMAYAHDSHSIVNTGCTNELRMLRAHRPICRDASSLAASLLYSDTKPGCVLTTMRFWAKKSPSLSFQD